MDKPQRWEPLGTTSEKMEQVAIDRIAREIYAQPHTFARKRLIRDHLSHWETAYSRWGTGLTKVRARDIEMIYNQAAPFVGEIDNDVADEFLICQNRTERPTVR